MRRLANIFKGDKVIWAVFMLLTLISLIAVYSAIGRVAVTGGHSPVSSWGKHVLFVTLAYLIVIAFANLNYRRFAKWARVAFWVSIALVVYVLVFCEGRWISIPGFGSFQPSELTKVTLLAMLAGMLTKNKEHLDDLGLFFQIMFIVIIAAGFILPENLSTALLLVVVCFVELYFGGINRKYFWRTVAFLGILGAVGLTAAVVTYKNGNPGNGIYERSATWGHRIDSWMNPNPQELTQENMARMAIASGKIKGVGVGHTVHARLMTQAENDFIYAIIIEESGMGAGLFVLFLYTMLFYRCLKMARRCKGMFGSLMLVGYGSLIYIQALVNMAVAVGAMPVTGQTLPLISNGGTAYLCMAMAVGVIQSVCYDTLKQEKEIKDKIHDDMEFEEVKNLSEQIMNGTNANL
ncbi:MAG: FtsW/RodA/SpoVE family cell cycle protein [Bacteroidales bacterium]|nr:FtsW/RodA/SpoVE family cell cycle protein [Bacteroidales bacterium]